MAPKTQRTYIPAPSTDYIPGDNISLGKIWLDPFDPESCLNIGDACPFPPDMPVRESYKADWEEQLHRENAGLLGMWARFLQIVGIDAEVSVSWENKSNSRITFKKLDTNYIRPTEAYMRDSIMAEDVYKAIVANNFKIRLYMVTGVRIARGARATHKHSSAFATKAVLGVDGTAAGAPAAAGPKISLSSAKSRPGENITYTGSSDFVFAYQLNEILYRKKLSSPRRKPFNKGALYSSGVKSEQTDSPMLESSEFVPGLIGLDEDGIEIEEEKYTAEQFEQEDGDVELLLVLR